MKTLIIFMVLLLATSAYSAPRLVTDPVDPATCGGTNQPTCPVSATCYEDGVEFVTEHPVETDMSINVDLADRPAGVHKYTCIYHDEFGGLSLQSNPTQLGSAAPQGLRLSP